MLRILTLSKNLYGTLIAGGIAAMLMFQILVNVGMTLGIMPVTGITLPLMSYGGSSVIATFLAIGLLQSIHVQARLNSTTQQGANPTVALSHLEHTQTQHARPDAPLIAAARCAWCSAQRRKETHEEEHPRQRRPRARPGSRARGEGDARQRQAPKKAAPSDEWKVAELYVERRGRRSIVGNIYKGKVDNVLPGMEAAFVDIGLERNGFLHVDEIVLPGGQAVPKRGRGRGRRIDELIKPGQEIIVQVVKDPLKTKGATALDAALDRRPLPGLHAAGRRASASPSACPTSERDSGCAS